MPTKTPKNVNNYIKKYSEIILNLSPRDQTMLKNHSKLSPRGYPDPLRDPLSPRALPRPRFLTILTPFWSPFWLPKATKNQIFFKHVFWDPLWRAFWELRASISRAFGNNFWYFLGPEWKSEKCDNPPERVWEGHFFDMFLHFFQHALLTLIAHRFLRTFGHFCDTIVQVYF